MSLVVWLPLNGSLENLGYRLTTIINNGASVDNNGKIGKCYSFNGTSNYISGTYKITDTITFACWVYFPSSVPNGRHIFDARTSNAVGYLPIYITTSSIQIGGSGSNFSTFGYNWAANTWYHICVTHNQNEGKCYINGALLNSSTAAKGFTGDICSFTLGSRCNLANYSAIKLNDVRIYDHCLSAAEVKEISLGLILHYKLDSEYNENTTNLAAGVVGYDYISIDVALYATAILGKTAYGNKIFTYSAYIKNTSDHPLAVRFNPYNAADTSYSAFNGNYILPGLEGRSIVTVDITDTSKWNGKVILYIQNGNSGTVPTNKTFYIKEVQVEEKNHATPFTPNTRNDTTILDSSGYNNNGTIIGTLVSLSDSCRYSNSIYSADGTVSRIITPAIYFPTDKVTLNIWFKSTNTSPTNNYHMVVDSNTHRQWYEMAVYNNGQFRSGLFVNGTRYVNNCAPTTVLDGNWHMLTVLYDGTAVRRYVDGVESNSLTVAPTSGLSTPTALTLFRDGPNATYACKEASISDFRIYCTALSADDIKSLYESSGNIDNKQNLNIYEVIETNSNLFAGKLLTSNYSAHVPKDAPLNNINSDGEYYFSANSTSAGSEFITINPQNHTYEYDFTISVNAGNQFYIGFERYDEAKTARSNNACVYVYSTKPASDVVRLRFTGTVNLSTDGTNPCKYVTLRILNGWSGTNSGVTGTATIHSLSLREIGTKYLQKITKQGLAIEEEIMEVDNARIYKNGIIEVNNLNEF